MCHFSLSSSFFFYFFIFFLVTPHDKSSSICATSVDVINQTCKTCADKSNIFSYNFCLTSLQVVPVCHATNLQGLAVIAMELALENATNTISSIKMLLNSKTFGPFALACLEDCLELYLDGVTTLVDAMGSFFTGHYSDANVRLSAVMEASTTCEEGFVEKKGDLSPLTKENYNLFQLCDIALCIVNMFSLAVHS